MLCLSRRIGERIVVGEGDTKVVITIIDIDRNKCRVGLEAAKAVKIYRSELLGETQTVTLPATEGQP